MSNSEIVTAEIDIITRAINIVRSHRLAVCDNEFEEGRDYAATSIIKDLYDLKEERQRMLSNIIEEFVPADVTSIEPTRDQEDWNAKRNEELERRLDRWKTPKAVKPGRKGARKDV